MTGPHSQDLAGKVAIVTGASSGIGQSAALTLAKAGAKVVLAARREEALQSLVKHIKGLGSDAIAVKTDVSSEADNKALVAAALDAFGRIDVAFLNAGLGGATGPISEVTEEDFDKVFGVNTKGVVFGLKYLIPPMKEAGGGSIIVNSTALTLNYHSRGAPMSVYTASKAAVDLFVEAASSEAAPVRVNSIHPGLVKTEATEGFGAEALQQMTEQLQVIPRPAQAEEIANFVVFLASDKSSFMTGGHHSVSGGWERK